MQTLQPDSKDLSQKRTPDKYTTALTQKNKIKPQGDIKDTSLNKPSEKQKSPEADPD